MLRALCGVAAAAARAVGQHSELFGTGVERPPPTVGLGAILVTSLDRLRAGPVDTAFVGLEFLYPGQFFSFKLEGEKLYNMRALGTASARLREILFTDYRLELRDSGRIDAGGQAVVQLDQMKHVARFDVLDC